MKRSLIGLTIILLALVFAGCLATGQKDVSQPNSITLPPPEVTKGKPLMQALNERHSKRQYSDKKLSTQQLSNLLWGANGVTRGEYRTAPSANNSQNIDIYVITDEAIYLYDAKGHTLTFVVGGDYRKASGEQDFVASAPVNLVFVADLSKIKADKPEQEKLMDSYLNCGFVSQNAYLVCASEGLSTVARISFDPKALSEVLKLKPTQKPIISQTVGFAVQ